MALVAAEGKLRIAQNKLDRAQNQLDECQADLDRMTAQFDEAMAEKAKIQADADATNKRMDAANKLIGGLSGERVRWTADSEAFADEIRRLAGDVALACAFTSYAGPFNAEFRRILIEEKFQPDLEKRKIPFTTGLAITSFMADAGTIGDWAQEGLPSDELSIQNGIMVTQSTKWPLLIDPQGQGVAWIKKRDEANRLRVTSLGDKRFRNALEDSMAFGEPLLRECRGGARPDPRSRARQGDPEVGARLQGGPRRQGVRVRRDVPLLHDDEARQPALHARALRAGGGDQLRPSPCRGSSSSYWGASCCARSPSSRSSASRSSNRRARTARRSSSSRTTCCTETRQLDGQLARRRQPDRGAAVDEDDERRREGEARQRRRGRDADRVGARGVPAGGDARRAALLPDHRHGGDQPDVPGVAPAVPRALRLLDRLVRPRAGGEAAAISNIIDYLVPHDVLGIQRGFFERHKTIWTLMFAMKVQQVAGHLQDTAVQLLLKGGAALDLAAEKPKPFAWLPTRCGSTSSRSRAAIASSPTSPTRSTATTSSGSTGTTRTRPRAPRCPTTTTAAPPSTRCSSCAASARTARSCASTRTSRRRSGGATLTAGRSTCARSRRRRAR